MLTMKEIPGPMKNKNIGINMVMGQVSGMKAAGHDIQIPPMTPIRLIVVFM